MVMYEGSLNERSNLALAWFIIGYYGKPITRTLALFSPVLFCFFLYHAPSRGDFSSAFWSSSASNTSSVTNIKEYQPNHTKLHNSIFLKIIIPETANFGVRGEYSTSLGISFEQNVYNNVTLKTVEFILTCLAYPFQVSGELSLYLLLSAKLQKLLPLLHSLSFFGKFPKTKQTYI